MLQEEMKVDGSNLVKPANTSESLYTQYFKEHRSMVDKIFVGQQQTVVDCVSCEHKSRTYLPFLEIVLSIVGMKTI